MCCLGVSVDVIIYFLTDKLYIMKFSQIAWPLFLAVFLICSCSKENEFHRSEEGGPTLELRDSPPNYIAYEDSLNSYHVDSADFVIYSKERSIWFDHTEGDISSTEWIRIKDTISDLMSTFPASPKFIDIDLSKDSIRIVWDDGGPSTGSPYPDDIHPDGGLNFIPRFRGPIAGTWCDDEDDSSGGGCGRVAAEYAGKRGVSQTTYFKNIGLIEITADCFSQTIDNWDDLQVIRYRTPDLWFTKDFCSLNHATCLDGVDLEDNEDVIDYFSDNLPHDLEVVQLNFARRLNDGNHEFWYFELNVGIPNPSN